MTYDRKALLKFAEDHWNRPVDDGTIFTKSKVLVVAEVKRDFQHKGLLPGPDKWQPVFIPEVDDSNQPVTDKERACFIRENPKGEKIPARFLPPELDKTWDIVPFHADKGLVDCAHYVSSCLTAGGLSINHGGVPELVQALRSRHDVKTLGHFVGKAAGERILATGVMKPGDLIAYIQKSHVKGGGYAHSVVYLGFDAGRKHHDLTCHTVPRFRQFYGNSNWWLTSEPDDWRFTLLHIAADDPHIPPSFLATLAGWWKVELPGGRTDFYHLDRKGNAALAPRAPTSAAQAVAHSRGSGYYFLKPGELVICWPDLARVDRWSLVNPDDSDSLDITVDGVAGTATRMF